MDVDCFQLEVYSVLDLDTALGGPLRGEPGPARRAKPPAYWAKTGAAGLSNRANTRRLMACIIHANLGLHSSLITIWTYNISFREKD